MEKFRLSLDADSLEDSRRESEVDKLREEVKHKQGIIEEKTKIIASLREQVNDLQHENEELENGEQLLKQKIDRFQREALSKDEEMEAVSHALKEVEAANEALSKRLEARTGQVQKYVDSLTKMSKELVEARSLNEQLQSKNELLTVELQSAKPRKRACHREPSDDEEIEKLKKELEVNESSWKLERQHKERYARENLQLDRKVNELTKELNNMAQRYKRMEQKCTEMERKLLEQKELPPLPPLPPKFCTPADATSRVTDENKTDVTAAIHFSMADEVGEIMDSSSLNAAKDRRPIIDPLSRTVAAPAVNNHCYNHRIKKSSFFHSDPIAEEKMRRERANELARRNMQTKPLHQTSYPLELDTFDNTNLTETEIKRGNVPRRPLADCSIQQQRRPVKKAEAFIV